MIMKLKWIALALSLMFIGVNCSAQSFNWALGIQCHSDDWISGIAVDGSGNIYVTGNYLGSMDLDPSGNSNVVTSPGLTNAYILKFSSNGAYQWGVALDCNGSSNSFDIAVDASSAVYVTGRFDGTIDLDPGPGSSTVTAGADHAFLIKLTSSGSLAWYRTAGNNFSFTEGRGVAVSANEVTVGGTIEFNGSGIDFDPGTGNTNTTFSTYDGFIVTYDLGGNFVRVRAVGTNPSSYNQVNNVAYDASGNLYAAGAFTAAFGLPNNGSYYGFVAKYAGASTTWAKSFTISNGSVYGAVVNGLAVDASGNVYAGVNYDGTVDLDPGSGTVSHQSDGTVSDSYDMGICKLNSSGTFVWANTVEGVDANFVKDLVVDSNGECILTGAYWGAVDFNPSGTAHTETHSGLADAFFMRYAANGAYDSHFAIGTFGMDRGLAIASAANREFLWGATHAYDCDVNPSGSIHTLPSTTVQFGDEDGFIAKYCISLDNPPVSNTPSQNLTACTGETTVLSVTPVPGMTYEWYPDNYFGSPVLGTGPTFTTPPLTFFVTYWVQAVNDCGDSPRLPISITVNPSPSITVTSNSTTLTAQQSGAVYQWLTCPAMTPIPGANSQSYSPASAGSYAVAITLAGCRDTSACVNFGTTSVLNQNGGFFVDVHPIPADHYIALRFNDPLPETTSIQVFDARGSMLLQTYSMAGERAKTIAIDSFSKGMYFIRISNSEQTVQIKFVK